MDLPQDILRGTYNEVAEEYYDRFAHPTCWNFRDASAKYLKQIAPLWERATTVVDVGAGQSLAAELIYGGEIQPQTLILLDRSLTMLRHSLDYVARGALLVIGDATACPLAERSCDLMISSLGDPYNVPEFWHEVGRCLAFGGRCVFTSPSSQWASQFRQDSGGEVDDFAYFVLRSGRSVYVPSYIRSVADQVRMIEEAGLRVEHISGVRAGELHPPISSKLRDVDVVLDAYMIRQIK